MKRPGRNLIGIILILLMAGGSVALAREKVPELVKRAVIRVDSITCGGCFATINSGLSQLEGFSGMGANLFRKRIAVDFEAPLTEDEILEKMAEVGYPGELETVEEISTVESFAVRESKRNRVSGGCCSGGTPGYGVQNGNQGGCGLQGGCPAYPGSGQLESL